MHTRALARHQRSDSAPTVGNDIGRGVASMAFTPDGKRLAAGYHPGTVKLWDLLTEQVVATFDGHDRLVSAVLFTPDGDTLITASGDPDVRIWRA